MISLISSRKSSLPRKTCTGTSSTIPNLSQISGINHRLSHSCDMRILYVTRPVFSIDIDKLDIPFLLLFTLVVKS